MLQTQAIKLIGLMLHCCSTAVACPFCIGFPDKSDADLLVEAHCVLLAREDPHAPFSFAPVEVLCGDFGDEEIELLVDTKTRKALAANERKHVVLIQREPNGPWQSLGIASADYEEVVRRILLLGPSWQGDRGLERRVQFFVTLFGHHDPQIYRLAYLESGRAPYDVVQRLGRVIQSSQLSPIMNDPRYIEWRSLAIVLLGQSQDPDDARFIWKSFESAQQYGVTTHLAALATAAIEFDADKALTYIEQNYAGRSDRTAEEIGQILFALLVHSQKHEFESNSRATRLYSEIAATYPKIAENTNSEFMSWQRSNKKRSKTVVADGTQR